MTGESINYNEVISSGQYLLGDTQNTHKAMLGEGFKKIKKLILFRVLVMGEGKIMEDGAPRELLKKPMGFFSSLFRLPPPV